MFVAVKPAALLGRPEMQPVLKLLTGNEQLVREFLLPIDQIDQLLIFWEGSPTNPANPGTPTLIPPPSGYIVRVGKTSGMEESSESLGFTQWRRFDTRVRRICGRREDRLAKTPMSIYTPDDRTAVLAADDLLRVLIEDRKEPKARPSWNDAWSQVTKGQINAVLETRWLRRRLNQGEIKLDTIAPLLEKGRAYALGINLDQELSADFVATVGEADDVKPVTETVQALLTLGRNAVPSLREHAADAGSFREASDWAVGTLATLLEKARIETHGPDGAVANQFTYRHCPCGPSRLLVREHGTDRIDPNSERQQSQADRPGLPQLRREQQPSSRRPCCTAETSGKVPYSWRVALLPYLEQQELYNSYNFDEPWDGPSNSKLLDKMPAVYGYPRLGGTSKTHTAYFVFTGAQTMLGKGDKPSFMDITDGMSNTILAVEASVRFPGPSPRTSPSIPQLPLPQIGGFTPDGHQCPVRRRLGPLRQANHQSDCFEGTDHAGRRRGRKLRFVLRQTV